MDRQSGVQSVLDNVAKQVFGRTELEALESNICIDCGKSAGKFRDKKSRAEYRISGLCQKCQDEIFGA